MRIPKQVDEFGNGEFEGRQVARDAKSDRMHACATMALLALLATWRSAVRQPIYKKLSSATNLVVTPAKSRSLPLPGGRERGPAQAGRRWPPLLQAGGGRCKRACRTTAPGSREWPVPAAVR